MKSTIQRQSLIAIAALVTGGFFYSWASLAWDHFNWGPPDFEATVSIPDFQLGEDPPVDHTRLIRTNMRGEWLVEIQRFDPVAGRFDLVQGCQGSGTALYTTTENPQPDWPLSFYAGVDMDHCFSEAGRYKTMSAWKMATEGSTDLQVFVADSNEFEVRPAL